MDIVYDPSHSIGEAQACQGHQGSGAYRIARWYVRLVWRRYRRHLHLHAMIISYASSSSLVDEHSSIIRASHFATRFGFGPIHRFALYLRPN